MLCSFPVLCSLLWLFEVDASMYLYRKEATYSPILHSSSPSANCPSDSSTYPILIVCSSGNYSNPPCTNARSSESLFCSLIRVRTCDHHTPTIVAWVSSRIIMSAIIFPALDILHAHSWFYGHLIHDFSKIPLASQAARSSNLHSLGPSALIVPVSFPAWTKGFGSNSSCWGFAFYNPQLSKYSLASS